MNFLIFTCFCILYLNYYYLPCVLANITLPLCSNNSICDNITSTEFYSQVNEFTTTEDDTYEEYFDFDESSLPQSMHVTSNNSTAIQNKNLNVHKVKADICLCDLTINLCDINCCCDEDCSDFQIIVFSHCNEYEAKVYDSRYCYKQNFIVRNNTKFVHEKIADNLFCIAYDNLPPKYNPREKMVYDLKLLKSHINDIEKTVIKWEWKESNFKQALNTTSFYKSGNLLWIFQGKFIKPLEFAQTGFTSYCNLKKSIRYLENWKESCYQSDLSNKNKKLFARNFSNFFVLSSPLLLNNAYSMIKNQNCPKNICIPLTNYFCADSWDVCTTKESRSGFCNNQTCENIVKSVKYLFRHNGTAGITNVSVLFKLANVTTTFYQQLEIEFEWINFDKTNTIKRSGNPGYILGKPIIFGISQITEKSKYITNSKDFLTLPYAGSNNECQSSYTIEFGKDAKTNCLVTLRTNNFSSDSCQQIQNRTLEIILSDLLFNSTEKNPSRTFVAKFGNLFDSDISNWVQILLDKVPKNLAKGYILQDQIWCENIIASMKIHVLHSLVTKPEGTNNHFILGIWAEFSNKSNISWPKCFGNNCLDVLQVKVQSFVTFHDASKPSKYHFAVGPSIDVRLPYDFFYPFISKSNLVQSSLLLIITIAFTTYLM